MSTVSFYICKKNWPTGVPCGPMHPIKFQTGTRLCSTVWNLNV